jgi:Ca2+-binding RTX toxin-like protein
MANYPGTPNDDNYPGTIDDDQIEGIGGDDILRGDAGNDTIDGGDGYDYLYGDAGNDTINGGNGNDVIQGGLGQDTLDGGAGYDRVDYTTFNGNATYNLGLGTASLGIFTETMLNFESIIAGGGNDTIIGTSVKDGLFGGAGNDTIDGGAGNDYIQGGLGQDTLDGGADVDVVDYTTFNGNGIYDLGLGTANLGVFTETMLNFESIYAGGGNDTITGTSVDNSLLGGGGNDTIYGGAGSDSIFGEAGGDTIQGGAGQDYLYGGLGNDTVDYTTFNGGGNYDLATGFANLTGAFIETMNSFENIKTGAGNDTIYGVAGDPNNYNQRSGNNISAGGGNDTIYGSIGDDIIYGGAGDDFILGSAGNDFILGGLGQDFLDGGSGGYDTVDYTTFSGNGIYDLRTGFALLTGAFTETMLNFESLYAGAGDDFIYGVDGNYSSPGGLVNNQLNGGAGNDFIRGGSGNDYIQGGLGQDTLDGGDNIFETSGDTADYTTFNGNGIYDLNAGTANLGVFTETMLNFESILTGAGNDTITGGSGGATGKFVDAGAGNDLINWDYGGSIYGGDGNDTIVTGSYGKHFIYGGAGNDTIECAYGEDVVYGDDGDDIIQGGQSNDTLNGGAGNDRFRFISSPLDGATYTVDVLFGLDTIADFTKTQDKIVLSTSTFLNITNAAGELSFATAISDTAAAFSDAKIVFSTSSNKLFYNQNGAGNDYGPNGGAFAVVNIVGGGVLASGISGDFTLIL